MSDAASDHSRRFTEGPIVWPLLALAGPLTMTQLLQVAYNLTDTFWVGRLGTDPVTALSFAWPIVFLLVSLGAGMTNAGTILVAQHSGAGNEDRLGHVTGQTMAFNAALSVVVAAFGFVFAPYLLTAIGATPGTAVHDQATTYLRIVVLGMPFTFGFHVFMAVLRGWGDTKTPMYLMVFSVGLNVLLDPFFVLGFTGNPLFGWLGLEGLQATLHGATGFGGLGVAGAAFATVLSRGLAAVVGAWLLFGGHVGLRLSIDDLLPERATIEKIVRIGTPGAIDQSTQSIAAIVMTALVATVSADAVAAYGIGNRFVSLVWLPMAAMGMSVETVVGQNLGGGHRDRARRTVYVAIAILGTVFVVASALTVVFAEGIVDLFVTGEGSDAVVDHGATFLRFVAPTWAIMAVYHMMNGAFYGSGSTRLAMIVGVTTLWGARAVLAIALVLLLGLGATGAWTAIALSNVTAAIAGAYVFHRGWWLGDVLDDASPAAADAEPESEADRSAAE
ncbi:MATE family efflux transporter [Salinarchaeum chitinilyticum]